MIKTLLKVLAGLVVLAVVAVAGFIYTFDANNYKQEITEMAEALTGRSMNIAGDMDISLYPWIGVKIHDLAIENPAGFSGDTFASVGEFDVKVKLVPLLQKRLEIDRLVMHGLDVVFEKNTAGENNWSDVAATAESESVQSKYGLEGLVIGGIDIKDSRISWLDRNSGKQFRISRMSLGTQAIAEAEALPVEIKAYVESNQPEWQAAVKATAKLDFAEGRQVFNADGLKLVVKALLPDQNMQSFSFAMLADSEINVKTHTAKLNNARFSALGQVASGTFEVEDIFSVPVIQGPVKVKKFELAKLAKYLKFDPPQMTDTQALKKISLTASLKTDFKTIQLNDIAAQIDDSRVTGFINIVTSPESNIRYDLKADTLNLDTYRIVENKPGDETLLPLEFIRTTDLEGVLAVASITTEGSELTDVHITSSIKNGMVEARPVTMQVHGGEVEVALQYDVRKTPEAVIVAKVNSVDAEHSINPLLKHLLGDESLTLEGVVDADADLKASGASVSALKKSMYGRISVGMDKVVVKGVDFEHASRTVVLDYSKRNDFRVSRTFKTEYDDDSTTEFNGLNATFRLSKGTVQNNDLSLVSDQLNVTGKGSIDFIGGTMDYYPVIDMKVRNTTNIRDKLRDHPMQYRAHGRLGEVAYKFDVDKYDLWVGRLMIQEAKAHKNRRINSKSGDSWQSVISKQK